MRLNLIGQLILLGYALSLPVLASPGDAGRLAFVRTKWNISVTNSDSRVIAAFDAKRYGIDWRDWISAFDCRAQTMVALAAGSYKTAWEDGNSCVAETVLEEIVIKAVDAPGIISWAQLGLSVSLNFLLISAEVEAFHHQQDLYFQARQFNSATTIANLAPFDFLDGVDITKEGRGWLFYISGYLRPFPTAMQPQEFFPLAESAWGVNGTSPTQIAAENSLYSAAFATAVATVPEPTVLPTIKLTMTGTQTCTVDFSGVLQQSTNLQAWEDLTPQPTSPYIVSTTDQSSRFFRARGY